MSPELNRPLPPYQRIVEHYRQLIRSGQLGDGDRLPSTRQLAARWEVAHATAAKVLTTLRTEGLVTTSTGGAGGTVVSAAGLGYTPRDRMLAVRTGRIYPPGEHARIVSASLVEAPGYVAEALGVEPGSAVIRRHRVTLRGETPVSASTSWFAGDLAGAAPGLLVAERIRQGTPGYIEERTGRLMRHGHDQFTAGPADAGVAAELGVAEGTPVIMGRNWVRDQSGDVLEFGEHVAVPTRPVSYEYELG